MFNNYTSFNSLNDSRFDLSQRGQQEQQDFSIIELKDNNDEITDNHENECGICQQSYEGQYVFDLECKHYFHT